MKFLVDRMLGKLAKELRMLGYDTIYYRGEDAYQLIPLARQEGRVILTRNTKLIPKRSEDRILRVTEDNPFLQLKELIQKGNITLDEEKLFSRCLSVMPFSIKSLRKRQREKFRISSSISRKNSSDVHNVRESIGRDLTRRICDKRIKELQME